MGLGSGIVDWWVKRQRQDDPLATPQALGISSPYSTSIDLPPILVGDLIPEDVIERLPLSREEAMAIPPVAKLRQLLAASLGPLPLVALRYDPATGDTRVPDQPSFLYRTNGLQAPEDRTIATIDDLLFYGCSLWRCERGAGQSPVGGPILSAWWIDTSRWDLRTVDGEDVIFIDDLPVPWTEVLLFQTPLFNGILAHGQRTMRIARDIEDATASRAKNPIPLLKLVVTEETQLTDDEIQKIADGWTARHRSTSPSVGVLTPGIDVVPLGETSSDFFQDARNASRGDVAAFAGVNAAMLDATSGVNSLTYTTKDGERSIFATEALPLWIQPFHSRLSMDDVVPSGQRIRFDQTALQIQPTPTGTPTED